LVVRRTAEGQTESAPRSGIPNNSTKQKQRIVMAMIGGNLVQGRAVKKCRILLLGCEVIKVAFRSAKSRSPEELMGSSGRPYNARDE
jgi:hypothetical protein